MEKELIPNSKTPFKTPKKPENQLFVRGGKGGPGRPKGLTKASYLDRLQSAVTPKQLARAVQEIYELVLNPKTPPTSKIRAVEFLKSIYLGSQPLVAIQIQNQPNQIEEIFKELDLETKQTDYSYRPEPNTSQEN